MKSIRKLAYTDTIAQGETLTDFKKRQPVQYDTLVAGIEREAFDDVVPRFHTVHNVPMVPTIFTFTGKIGKAGDQIELTHGGRQFLIEYNKLAKGFALDIPFAGGAVERIP